VKATLREKTIEEESMAKRRISMRKIQEVLRLKWEQNLTNEKVSRGVKPCL